MPGHNPGDTKTEGTLVTALERLIQERGHLGHNAGDTRIGEGKTSLTGDGTGRGRAGSSYPYFII
jgi:hypothetical protein